LFQIGNPRTRPRSATPDRRCPDTHTTLALDARAVTQEHADQLTWVIPTGQAGRPTDVHCLDGGRGTPQPPENRGERAYGPGRIPASPTWPSAGRSARATRRYTPHQITRLRPLLPRRRCVGVCIPGASPADPINTSSQAVALTQSTAGGALNSPARSPASFHDLSSAHAEPMP
jgi:hypothetical protein